jgi:hypothetical protein
MPFDGPVVEIPRIALEKIDRIFVLLRSADRWCQGAMERDGGRRCILGAMRAAHAELLLERPILHAVKQVTGHNHRGIESFNVARPRPMPWSSRYSRRQERISATALIEAVGCTPLEPPYRLCHLSDRE